jgi:hypothetical protein
MVERIVPDWPAPDSVLAFSTTRVGGCSGQPYNSLNVGTHVGDDAERVGLNRALLTAELPLGSQLQWLTQVHGVHVIRAGTAGPEVEADASWSVDPGQVCAIMTADCLPVLFSSTRGDCVAAAHAGWRGLAGGVLEATLKAMPCAATNVMAWLGPCIGPAAFEVGADVREAFLRELRDDHSVLLECFASHPTLPGKYLADLHGLARARLLKAGVSRVYAYRACTYSQPQRFFSFRRDGQTGRMATVIALKTGA